MCLHSLGFCYKRREARSAAQILLGSSRQMIVLEDGYLQTAKHPCSLHNSVPYFSVQISKSLVTQLPKYLNSLSIPTSSSSSWSGLTSPANSRPFVIQMFKVSPHLLVVCTNSVVACLKTTLMVA